jgi:hypothetical protein
MKKHPLLAIILLLAATSFAQTKYEPQILILSPNSIKVGKQFEVQINELNKRIREQMDSLTQGGIADQDEFKKQPENWQRMQLADFEYVKKMDFFKQVNFISTRYLTYRFGEQFPDLLILPKDIKSGGGLAELGKLAGKEHLQYILNFPSVELYQQQGISYSKIRLQLYDNDTRKLVLDHDYIGNWKNPGFEFCCQDSSLDCTISNALSQALADVIDSVMFNSPKIKREISLAGERSGILSKELNKPFDKDLVKSVVTNDSNINPGSMYQCLISDDKTKFVAFFLEPSQPGFDMLKGNKKDKNINVITNKDIRDSGYLDQAPQLYAYTVCGVQYKGKWYYEKENVTYFDAATQEEGRLKHFNQLQLYNFFKDNSIEVNPDFWQTKFFEQIKDITKDPKWEKYGKEMFELEEKENRPYIGMYKIVADQLKKEQAAKGQ